MVDAFSFANGQDFIERVPRELNRIGVALEEHNRLLLQQNALLYAIATANVANHDRFDKIYCDTIRRFSSNEL